MAIKCGVGACCRRMLAGSPHKNTSDVHGVAEEVGGGDQIPGRGIPQGPGVQALRMKLEYHRREDQEADAVLRAVLARRRSETMQEPLMFGAKRSHNVNKIRPKCLLEYLTMNYAHAQNCSKCVGIFSACLF